MAVIRSHDISNSVPISLYAGWLICMVFAVLCIKLKWFRRNLQISNGQDPISAPTVVTGVYRQSYNPELYSSLVHENFASRPQPKKTSERPNTNKTQNPLATPSTSSSNKTSKSSSSTQLTSNVKPINPKQKTDKDSGGSKLKAVSPPKVPVDNKNKSTSKPDSKQSMSISNEQKSTPSSKTNDKQKPPQTKKSDEKDKSKDKSKLKDKEKAMKEKQKKDDKKSKQKNVVMKKSGQSGPPEIIDKRPTKQNPVEVKKEGIYETPIIATNNPSSQQKSNAKNPLNKNNTETSNGNVNQFGSNAYSSAAASIFLGGGYEPDNDVPPPLPQTSRPASLPKHGIDWTFKDTDSVCSNTSA